MMTADDADIAAVFATLFEESPMGIVRLDGAGAIVCCNGVMARMLGTSPDALRGRAFADTFAAEDRDDVRAQLAKLVMGATRRTTIENLRLAADNAGGERSVQLFATVIEQDGELRGMLAHVLDKTDRYNLEMGLAHAQKLQALGQLAGSIAHDFNNLITAMLGSCEMLLRDSRPGCAGYDDLADIRSTALRARELVRQLLSFARKQPLRPIPLRLDRAIEDLLPMLRRLLGAGISIETRHDPRLPLARMDPGRFDQVIVNLAVNARDAMRSAGRLTLSTERLSLAAATQLSGHTIPAGSYVQVQVSDTGIGIPKEIIDDIFQPFFTTKPQGEGTGLGLATVYGIVRQSGGCISVDSALGSGATFRILLPAAEPAADAVRPPDRPTSAAARRVRGPRSPDHAQPREARILLVEDDQAVRRFAARALRGHGWSVMEAADGEGAMQALADTAAPFDILLSDLTLPDMNGSAVIEQARRSHPQVPIVIISADPAAAETTETSDNRLFHLPKPFSLAELVLFVEHVLSDKDPASKPARLYPHPGGS
jgi:two-component system cell cycle sensor histidine kinase/response regulator CckA